MDIIGSKAGMRKETTMGPLLYEALERFAEKHGKHWKRDLRRIWETGTEMSHEDGYYLRAVRNTLGPSGLAAFRFDRA